VDDQRDLTPEQEFQIQQALASPRGRYTYTRAAQLSGIPQRTVHHWAHVGLVVPDFPGEKPKMWSYRDLVFLRFFAWLRTKKMRPSDASERVSHLRDLLIEMKGNLSVIYSDGMSVFVEGEDVDRLTQRRALTGVSQFLGSFDLLTPLDEDIGFGKGKRVWGPHLVHPSTHTSISPWVLGGDPCVQETRIPSSGLYALKVERGLGIEAIVRLYPDLKSNQVADAIRLEEKLRVPAAA
jgi:uncharacterized protein (DUF433 family)/DNA-binding transcriptional MerR regulator